MDEIAADRGNFAGIASGAVVSAELPTGWIKISCPKYASASDSIIIDSKEMKLVLLSYHSVAALWLRGDENTLLVEEGGLQVSVLI